MGVRTDIRKSVVAALKAGVPQVADRVFPSRPDAIFGNDIETPAISVYTREEVIENPGPRVQNRRLSLAVELVLEGHATVDNDVDELADTIEQVMLAGLETEPGYFFRPEIEQIEIGFVDQGRRKVGGARLTFGIDYETNF